MPRKKKTPDSPEIIEYKQKLQQFHNASKRHVLVLEADLPEDDKRHIFHDADILRRCGNELTGIMKNCLDQLFRTKRYRNLKRLYGKYSESGDIVRQKEIAAQMNEMQKQYHVTWDFCRKEMIRMKDEYGVHSVFALARAEDIWSAIEKVLYSDAEALHFHKHGELPNIRAKQIERGIVVHVRDGRLCFSYKGKEFTYKDNDRFVDDETAAVMRYLVDPDSIDRRAVQKFDEDGSCMDTYRPCYASLVCKTIRGKLRVYIHLTIEGNALPKFDRLGQPRHIYGEGRIGCDIGTQTYAYTAQSEVGLKNLAERGDSIKHIERQERLLLRKMDRSRRATNPDNYNEDGTIRPGRKKWECSKRCQKLKAKYQDLCRKSAENRRLAIHEDVNYLRSLGDTLITEPKNFKALQRKAKSPPSEACEAERPKRRRRFGKSLKNRCPGYMHAQLKRKFESTGGHFHEVPYPYSASQYDHTADDYVKRKLSQRMFCLADGTQVQRDWYSSFLLFCADETISFIDRETCLLNFPSAYEKEKKIIEEISRAGLKILNSGIHNISQTLNKQ